MRATLRLFASVKPGRYLTPYAPTGITGLATHPSPRPTLIYLYNSTLDKLKAFPESSGYRQATEALTKHRLSIIESTKPPGFELWQERVRKQIEKDPERFRPAQHADGSYAAIQREDFLDPDDREWNGDLSYEVPEGAALSEEEAEAHLNSVNDEVLKPNNEISWEAEPQLEASQISDIEKKIGAGLIEEVIQVAEGENKLVHVMFESKVWEELEEKPQPGQWSYFER